MLGSICFSEQIFTENTRWVPLLIRSSVNELYLRFLVQVFSRPFAVLLQFSLPVDI